MTAARAKMGPEAFDLVIMSDLHLSEGLHPRTRRFSRNEDFFFDNAFARFLSYLERDPPAAGRRWHLIIAGDMVDFLQVTRLPEKPLFDLTPREKEYGLGTGPERSVWKLKVIMEGHEAFFDALGRFLRTGNRCTIISGNHDIEWTVSEVREAFRQEITKHLPKRPGVPKVDLNEALSFCPWFYYEPGLLWVEHGHQYDGMNAYDSILTPDLPNEDRLMLPGGSFFVRYLFNSVERKDPFADNIKPTSAYLGRYWWQILFSPHIIRNLGHFLDILRKIRKFDETELGILRKKHKAAMRVEADRFGIDIKTLEAASRLWIPSFLYNESKVANIWRFMTYEPESTYRNRAARIQNLLNVKYVVFGHTHEADLFLFSHESGEYANSGTWTKIFSKNPAEQLLREEQESVYVQILRQEGKLELMRWRDELGIGERVNLFE